MSTESITLTRGPDEWIATDDQAGAEGRGPTREAALEELDEQRRQDPVQIVKTPDVLGGKPRLDGTRIGVFTIGESIREGDQSIEGILDGYPDLSRAQVEAVLAYYDAHLKQWMLSARSDKPRNTDCKLSEVSNSRSRWLSLTQASGILL